MLHRTCWTRWHTPATCICTLGAFVIGIQVPAQAWGTKGHETVNGIAIKALHPPLRQFYQSHQSYIVKHAMDADHARGQDPSEAPRHWVNLDLYGEPPTFGNLPEEYGAAVARYGRATVHKRGVLPWVVEKFYQDLVEAFRRRDGKAVLYYSAWVGHYVGDAHVPLHSYSDYDGKAADQKGLHGWFETTMVNQKVDTGSLQPPAAIIINKAPQRLAFDWLRESFAHVNEVLAADRANGGVEGGEPRDMTGFAQVAQPIAVDRLTKASSRLASLWYSAWIAAGQPNPASFTLTGNYPTPQPVPAQPTGNGFIGNGRTKVFHRVDCESLPAPARQVSLRSRRSALAQGYRPCQRCQP